MKKLVFVLAVALLESLVCNYALYKQNDVRADTVTVERIDTQYFTKTDTLPIVIKDTVTGFVKIPVVKDSLVHDTLRFDMVQRTYTDDSTYTAYVSGLQYEDFPKLDSIAVRQRTILQEVERTVINNKRQRLNFGVQAGAGIGIISRKPDVYVGFGVQYSF